MDRDTILKDVNAVLGGASKQKITSATPDNQLLKNFIFIDRIDAMYIQLKKQFKDYTQMDGFSISKTKDTTSVGDVRKAVLKSFGLE